MTQTTVIGSAQRDYSGCIHTAWNAANGRFICRGEPHELNQQSARELPGE